MLLPTVLSVFLACGFAMFFLANAASFVIAVVVLTAAEVVLALNFGNGFDRGLLNGAAALGAMQLGYSAALALAACWVRRESEMNGVEGAGER